MILSGRHVILFKKYPDAALKDFSFSSSYFTKLPALSILENVGISNLMISNFF
jgi:hypothetical protein